MAKTKISEWSTTPASNTDIDGINIAEGCAPSGINDAIRDLMAQVRSWQSGASGDPFNGPMNGTIGATTAYSGAFTNITASGTLGVTGVATLGAGAILNTPASVTLTNATGLPISTGVSGLGTGVATALAVNVGSAGAPVVNGGALGTPSSGTVTNLTGTASININGTVGATTPTTGAFTTLTTSSTVTLNGGTANGVTYLNGSKVLTSGSALTFDGSNLLVAAGLGASIRNISSTTQANLRLGSTFTTGTGGANTDWSIVQSFSAYGDLVFRSGTAEGDDPRTTGSTRFQFLRDGTAIWSVGGSEQMRLTSTGLGIGTSSPATKLQVSGADAIFRFTNTNGGTTDYGNDATGTYWRDYTNSAFRWVRASGAESMRLDSAGNLGLGVTPSAWGSTYKAFQVGFSSSLVGISNDTQTHLTTNARFDGTNWVYIGSSPASRYMQDNNVHKWFNVASGTAGTNISFTQAMTLDASGNLGVGTTSPVGRLDVTGNYARFFENASGAEVYLRGYYASIGAAIQVVNNFPLLFLTNNTERARIDSSGNLLLNTTSTGLKTNRSMGFQVTGGCTQFISHSTSDASGDSYVEFGYNGTKIGSITQSGTTAVLYNVTSDQRLKENIQNADSASSLIDSLQVRKFDWKADGNHQRYGFVAQELVAVAPEAVHQPADSEEMMAVDYSKLVPMLVKEIQSLRQRVAQLETN